MRAAERGCGSSELLRVVLSKSAKVSLWRAKAHQKRALIPLPLKEKRTKNDITKKRFCQYLADNLAKTPTTPYTPHIMSELLRGHILAKNIQEKVASRVAQIGKPLGLAVILVGEDPASHLYVSLKEKSAKEAGIYVEPHRLANTIAEQELLDLIHSLNERNDIHGILVQFPLPKHINETAIIEAIDINKDVDGFRRENLEKLERGEPSLVPPVALAVLKLIGSTLQPLRNKNAIIISNSEIFSKPILALMKEQGIQGQYVNPASPSLSNITQAADILVVAVGKTNFIREQMISSNAILIDVGTNRGKKGVRGDITKAAKEKAAFATPVPGGVGPLTVAYLLLNVLKAYELQSAKK